MFLLPYSPRSSLVARDGTASEDYGRGLAKASRPKTIYGPVIASAPTSALFSAYSPPIFVPPPKSDRRNSLIYKIKKKPYTAVTVQVERLTSEHFDENDFSGIPELIESVRLQESGPREASRAIRKKLLV